ncbi:MAG: type II toxin-antitoxin system RelE/ParE family toxin [Candidatus Tectomicrobia bacterium]|nr:type II toxin-antitoxin system RelE/ParE family toxin [Candidatus Tectomicrobia bacterium]
MTLKWTRRALRDMQHLHDYIAEDNPAAARRMVSRIRDASRHLRRNPHIGKTGRVVETRELTIAGTSYIVVYCVEGQQVQIVAVIHGAQRWPDSFNDRD